MTRAIAVVNAGSSSVKFSLYADGAAGLSAGAASGLELKVSGARTLTENWERRACCRSIAPGA